MAKKTKLPLFEGDPRMAKNLFIPDAARCGELMVYNPWNPPAQGSLPQLPSGTLFVRFKSGIRYVLGPSFDVEVHDIRERASDLLNKRTSYNPNSSLFRNAREFNKLSTGERLKRFKTEQYAFGPEVEFKCRVLWFVQTIGQIKEFVNGMVHIGSMHRITTEGVKLSDREWYRVKLQSLRSEDESIGRKPRRS